MSKAPKKWTKKDIGVLTSQLDTFWLQHRPLGMFVSAPDLARAEEHCREVLTKQRKEIVLAGLRAARESYAARYRSTCETIGNAIVRDVYGAGRDAFVAKFTEIAKDEDRAAQVAEALVLRVVREGLPPEVETYDPTAK